MSLVKANVLRLRGLLGPTRLTTMARARKTSIVMTNTNSKGAHILACHVTCVVRRKIRPFRVLTLAFAGGTTGRVHSHVVRIIKISGTERVSVNAFRSMFSHVLHTRTSVVNFSHGFAVYSRSSSGDLIGRVVGRVKLSRGGCDTNSIRGHVSSVGGGVILPHSCTGGCRFTRRSSIHNVTQFGSICLGCYVHYHRTGTVSFSSLLICASRLFHRGPRILRQCRSQFHCILISRCRSAGAMRRSVIVGLITHCNGVYIINSSTRDVCSFHKTRVSGVLNFHSGFTGYGVFGLRRGCHSARGVIGTTGSLVTGGCGRVPGGLFSSHPVNSEVPIISYLSSNRRTLYITGRVGSLLARRVTRPRSVTILCHGRTRDHIVRRTLHGGTVPCGVCNKVSFCRHGRVGSILTCLQLIIGPSSRRTLHHIVGAPTHKVNSAAINQLFSVTGRRPSAPLLTVVTRVSDCRSGVGGSTTTGLGTFTRVVGNFIRRGTADSTCIVISVIMHRDKLVTRTVSSAAPRRLSHGSGLGRVIATIRRFYRRGIGHNSGRITLIGFLGRITLVAARSRRGTSRLRAMALVAIRTTGKLRCPCIFVINTRRGLFPDSIYRDRHSIRRRHHLVCITVAQTGRHYAVDCTGRHFVCKGCRCSGPDHFLRSVSHSFLSVSPNGARFHRSNGHGIFISPCKNNLYSGRG